jgi:hypothetical protein
MKAIEEAVIKEMVKRGRIEEVIYFENPFIACYKEGKNAVAGRKHGYKISTVKVYLNANSQFTDEERRCLNYLWLTYSQNCGLLKSLDQCIVSPMACRFQVLQEDEEWFLEKIMEIIGSTEKRSVA